MPGDQPSRARWFNEVVVSPTLAEAWQKPESIRLALLAAIAVNQLADYLFHCGAALPEGAKGSKLSDWRDAWGRQSKAVALVRDIADAGKHMTLDRKTAQIRDLSSARTEPAGWDNQTWDELIFDADDYVVVDMPDGTEVGMLRLVEDAHRFYEAMLT